MTTRARDLKIAGAIVQRVVVGNGGLNTKTFFLRIMLGFLVEGHIY